MTIAGHDQDPVPARCRYDDRASNSPAWTAGAEKARRFLEDRLNCHGADLVDGRNQARRLGSGA